MLLHLAMSAPESLKGRTEESMPENMWRLILRDSRTHVLFVEKHSGQENHFLVINQDIINLFRTLATIQKHKSKEHKNRI